MRKEVGTLFQFYIIPPPFYENKIAKPFLFVFGLVRFLLLPFTLSSLNNEGSASSAQRMAQLNLCRPFADTGYIAVICRKLYKATQSEQIVVNSSYFIQMEEVWSILFICVTSRGKSVLDNLFVPHHHTDGIFACVQKRRLFISISVVWHFADS